MATRAGARSPRKKQRAIGEASSPAEPEDSLVSLLAGIAAHIGVFLERRRAVVERDASFISLKRLDARPIATLSLEAQERHERREKVFRED